MQIRKSLLILLGIVLFSGCLSNATPISDDFSDPASGWGAASTETFVRGYDSGKYLIRIDAPNWFVWTTAGRRYSDVSLEVTANAEGMPDNHYGLICRQSNEGAYYFAVSADGYYAIFRQDSNQALHPLTGPAMLRSTAIHKGNESNTLLAICEGSELTFYVNGEQIAQVEDDTLNQGDIGMAAGTAANAEATLVWFDDFTANKP